MCECGCKLKKNMDFYCEKCARTYSFIGSEEKLKDLEDVDDHRLGGKVNGNQ